MLPHFYFISYKILRYWGNYTTFKRHCCQDCLVFVWLSFWVKTKFSESVQNKIGNVKRPTSKPWNYRSELSIQSDKRSLCNTLTIRNKDCSFRGLLTNWIESTYLFMIFFRVFETNFRASTKNMTRYVFG